MGGGKKRNKSGCSNKGKSPKLSPQQKKAKGSIRDYMDLTPELTDNMAEMEDQSDTPQNDDIKEIQDTLKIILLKLEPMEKVCESLNTLTKNLIELRDKVDTNSGEITAVKLDVKKMDTDLEEVKRSLT